MTQIYCVKCKKFTHTKSEEFVTTENGRTRLIGICKTCNTKKGMFVNKNKEFNKKSKKELEEERIKRHDRTIKKKALAIGQKILDNKDEKNN